MTNSIKINGHWVLSGGDLICVYSIAQKMAYMWGWCDSLITDLEWISRKGVDQYLVAQVSGNICLNIFSEKQQLKQLGKVINLTSRKSFFLYRFKYAYRFFDACKHNIGFLSRLKIMTIITYQMTPHHVNLNLIQKEYIKYADIPKKSQVYLPLARLIPPLSYGM